MKENALHRAIIAHLKIHGVKDCVTITVNNNPRSAKDGARLKAQGLVPGVFDLFHFWRGQYFGHEIKTEKGKLSPAQKLFHQRFADTGGIVLVTYGLNHAIELLADVGLCRGRVQ